MSLPNCLCLESFTREAYTTSNIETPQPIAACGPGPIPCRPGSSEIAQSDSSGGPEETSVKDRDCSDFDTQPEAQRFFERHQPGALHNLDEACESLPGGP